MQLEVCGLFREPAWKPETVSRADGGRVHASWADKVSFFALGLGTDVPLPDLGSSGGITARMELDDLLDDDLPLRPGAPRRGRRLTVVLTGDLTGAP